jgi:hypothetical protein
MFNPEAVEAEPTAEWLPVNPEAISLAGIHEDFDVVAWQAPDGAFWLGVPISQVKASFVVAFPLGIPLPASWRTRRATVASRDEGDLSAGDLNLEVVLVLMGRARFCELWLLSNDNGGSAFGFGTDGEYPHAASLKVAADQWLGGGAPALPRTQAALVAPSAPPPLPPPGVAQRGAREAPRQGFAPSWVQVSKLEQQMAEMSAQLAQLRGEPAELEEELAEVAEGGDVTPHGPSSATGFALARPPFHMGAARATAAQPQQLLPADGYGQGPRSAGQAAHAAREQARHLLAKAGFPPAPPAMEHGSRPRQLHPQADRDLASALGRAAAPPLQRPEVAGDMTVNLLESMSAQVAAGQAPDQGLMRLVELQVLSQLASNMSGRKKDSIDLDPLGMAEPDAGGASSFSMARGTETLQRVQASRDRDPKKWCSAFDLEIQRELFATVTGRPWSLMDYVQQRMRFSQPHDSDLEHMLHMVCALHAAHRTGEDSH